MKKPADLHLHTQLSLCSGDPEATASNYRQAAFDLDLPAIAITDHMWDSAVCPIRNLYAANDPSYNEASPHWTVGFYEAQDHAHIEKGRETIPQDSGQVHVLFGCESEYQYGVWGISPTVRNELDIVLTPHSHQHMNPAMDGAPPQVVADYMLKTFEEVLRIPEITYIAHPLMAVGAQCGDALAATFFPENELRRLLALANEQNKVLELNFGRYGFMPQEELRNDPFIRLWRLQKEMGCKVYMGSDSHHLTNFRQIWSVGFDRVVEAVGLVEDDFHPTAWLGPQPKPKK